MGRVSPASIEAQTAYYRKYGIKRISLAEAQRIDDCINSGMSCEEAGTHVFIFFEMHRQAFEFSKSFECGQDSQDAYDKFIREF